ncbi:hypothetical protein [Parasaccharibacter sp. TMW 2.1884]|uniref:hypothetical protein n=1 Tax=Parasaccharibacter sp. TMW 2.1884 TaxID=2267834 RepID=UPI0020138EF6|nr:hypothetical protein [Parasaccharibacter sp. TMW 2.1884]
MPVIIHPTKQLLKLALARYETIPLASQVELMGALSKALGIETIADLANVLKEEK